MKKLNAKVKILEAAEEAVIKELARLYPVGSRVSLWLMCGQVTPSRGEVISHQGSRHAYVRVRLDSRKQEVRSITAGNIISCSPCGDNGGSRG